MRIKFIDYLSPKITLFYYGDRRHSSFLGGLLTILMVVLSSVYVSYLIYSIVGHANKNFMLYKSYLIDAGQFYFNDTTGIFHYFQLYDIRNKLYGEYNKKYVRIFMSRLYRSYINNREILSENEHWVYDSCREGLDNKHINKNLFIDNVPFKNGACLRYYYNNNEKKYYPIEDVINFKYPYIIHGTGNKNNLFLETIVEKCDNSSVISSLLGFCGSEQEIEDYFEQFKGINFQLLSKRVDTENYQDPIYQYFHSFSESLDIFSVPVDNINLMPFFIEIKTGIIFPIIHKLETYALDVNRRENWGIYENTKVLAIFDYWLQNSAQVIKGGYNTIYDILPSIGGIIQLIYYIFYSFNFLYNKYVTIQDCNRSFFRMYNSEDQKGVPMKNSFIKCVNSLRYEVNKKFSQNSNKIIAAIREKRDSIYIAKYNRSKKSFKSDIQDNSAIYDENNKIDLSNSNDLMGNLHNNLMQNSMNNNNKITRPSKSSKILSKNEAFIKLDLNKKNNLTDNFEKELNEFIRRKNKAFKVEPFNIKITTKYMNFINFFFYVLNIKRKNTIYFILNQFRLKLLGEEHLFKSNIILYHIEKYFNIKEIQKVDILELYNNL